MNDYPPFVRSLVKPGADILSTMTPEKAELWHYATGLSGEAGELLDAVKKHCIYNKPLDIENAIEELGDLEFFMEAFRQRLGLSREAIIERNTAKLKVRYGDKYSDQSAQERRDKADYPISFKGVPFCGWCGQYHDESWICGAKP